MNTKVVKILTETELVLGAGSDKGVEIGMEFVIYENGEEIIDPATSESLGHLEIIKGYVLVVNVQEKLSVCKTKTRTITKTRTTTTPTISAFFGARQQEEYEIDKVEKLRVESTDPDYIQRLIVRVGDNARLTRRL